MLTGEHIHGIPLWNSLSTLNLNHCISLQIILKEGGKPMLVLFQVLELYQDIFKKRINLETSSTRKWTD